MTTIRALLVDDDRDMCELLATCLAPSVNVRWTTSADEAFEFVLREDFDVVVTDIKMAGMDGLDFCSRIVQNRGDVPVIVMTAFGSLETAVATIRAGAADFLMKPFRFEELGFAIERAATTRALRVEVKRLRQAVADTQHMGEMLGASPAMRSVFDLIARVGKSDVPMLITGESGTGKELVARAIHAQSTRHAGPFVAINCSALPEALLESELFGHVRGSFTGANVATRGLFLEASGGTLFLDEIGELSLALQPKLLRALESRTVRHVGATDEVPFDANVIAATNRDLEAAIGEKLFREDLYYRVNVVHIELPPLRARGNDILLLAQHFVSRAAARLNKPVHGLSPTVAEKLFDYSWPGNVRELQNCMDRAVALARFEDIVVDDLPERVRSYKASHILVAAEDPTELVSMEVVEQRYIRRVLEAVGGNKSNAARILGYDRKTLYRRLESYGITDIAAARQSPDDEDREQ